MMMKIMVVMKNAPTMVMIVIMIIKMMMGIMLMENITEPTCQVLLNFVP